MTRGDLVLRARKHFHDEFAGDEAFVGGFDADGIPSADAPQYGLHWRFAGANGDGAVRDVGIGLERIFTENTDDKRGLFIGESNLWPLDILRQLVEISCQQ